MTKELEEKCEALAAESGYDDHHSTYHGETIREKAAFQAGFRAAVETLAGMAPGEFDEQALNAFIGDKITTTGEVPTYAEVERFLHAKYSAALGARDERIRELETKGLQAAGWGFDKGIQLHDAESKLREQSALLREAISMIEKYRMGFAPEYEMSIAFTEHATAALGPQAKETGE